MNSARLNDVLIAMSRSLLQYVGEASPWTPATDDDVGEQLLALVRQQQTQIARLAELLSRRVDYFDAGTYPTDYTDLQYLSLAYLLDRLIRDQQAVADALNSAARDCGNDDEARELLSQLETGVAQTIQSLRELSAKATRRQQPSITA